MNHEERAADAFTRVLAPLTIVAFNAGVREQRHHHVERNQPDRFHDLVSVDDIEQILWSRPTTKNLRVASSDHEIDENTYRSSNGHLDPIQVLHQYADGATIVAPAMHHHHPRLAELCTALSIALHAPVQANTYLTPRCEQGFKLHFDTHDVIVVQVEGAKRWYLHDDVISLPLRGQRFDSLRHEFGPPTHEVVLRAGDSLYVPRGVPHAAMNQLDERSLHVTLGVLTQTRAEILIEAVSAAALENPLLRAGAHDILANACSGDSASLRCKLNEALTIVRDVNVDALREAFVDSIERESRRLTPGTLAGLDSASDLNDDDRLVRPDPAVRYTITVDDERVQLHRRGQSIDLPLGGRAALEYVAENAETRVGDIPGLDQPSRLTLATRLIRDGFLIR